MSDQNTDTIYATANRFDLDLPAAVTQAQALLDAATALCDQTAAEAPPALDASVTAKTLAATHKRLVEYETRDARLRAAETLVKHAQANLDNARFVSARELHDPLRAVFTEQAAAFTHAHAALGGHEITHGLANPEAWQDLRAAAGALDSLANARSAYSPRGSRAHCALGDTFEAVSRCLRVPHRLAFTNHRPSGRGEAFWGAALDAGYTITWQTNDEQQENCDAVARSQNPRPVHA